MRLPYLPQTVCTSLGTGDLDSGWRRLGRYILTRPCRLPSAVGAWSVGALEYGQK